MDDVENISPVFFWINLGGLRDLPRSLSAFFFPHGLALSLFIGGLFYLALTPPYQSPDEENHFARAYQLSEGQLFGIEQDGAWGAFIPKALVNDIVPYHPLAFHPERRITFTEWKTRLQSSPKWSAAVINDRQFDGIWNTVVYSPLVYYPEIAALEIGKRLPITVFETFYLARLLALCFSSAVVWWSLSLVSFSKRLTLSLFLIAAMPMSLFQLASNNADSVTFSLAYLTIALMLKVKHSPSETGFFLFLLASALLSLCKSTYVLVPLVILPFLWFENHWKGNRVKCTVSVIGCAFLPAVIWTLLAKSTYHPVIADHQLNAGLQMHYMLTHPLHSLRIFIHMFHVHGDEIRDSFVGMLGWLDTRLPSNGIKAYCFLLLLAPLVALRTEPKASRLDFGAACFAFALFMAFTGLICVTIYACCNTVQSSFIEGVQGRYFIPMAPALLLSLPVAFRLREKHYAVFSSFVIGGWFAMTATTLVTLYQRYWQ